MVDPQERPKVATQINMNEQPESMEAKSTDNASHHADTASAVSQPSSAGIGNGQRKHYQIKFHRLVFYVATATVEARSKEGAEDIAEHILFEAHSLDWDKLDIEDEVAEVFEIQEGGSNE